MEQTIEGREGSGWPHVAMRQNRRGELRAIVEGTRIRVQDIVYYYEREGQNAEEIASSLPAISIAQVHSALGYYFENRKSIRDAIESDSRYVAEQEKKLSEAKTTE